LVKPVRPTRLAQAVARLEAKPANDPAWKTEDRICFRTPERTVVARPEAVIALEADGDFTHVYVEGESPLLICHKLGYYEQTLPSPPFLRLDRSLIIHLDHVKKVESIDSEHANLHLSGFEKTFLLGRTARRRLAGVISS
ncbi:MAG: LytTR family transcriptional regulator DNA-binding domain-containing protein, partial [Chthoniobacterales bacterium]